MHIRVQHFINEYKSSILATKCCNLMFANRRRRVAVKCAPTQVLQTFIKLNAISRKLFRPNFVARKNHQCMVHIICKLDTFEWIARWKNSCQEFTFQMVSKLMTHFRHFSCRQLNAINDVTCPMNHTFWAIKYDSSLKCKRIPEKFPELTGWNWTSNDLRRWKSATVTLNEILKMNF